MTSLGLFVSELVRTPRTIAALAPSSVHLAREMVVGIGPRTGPVAEFGPGTGVFTRALLDAGVAPQDLTLFEVNPAFAAHLRAAFPGVRVVNEGAQTIDVHCPDGVSAIVSGMPILSFPAALNRAIFTASLRVLRPGGMIRQFTYGPKSPLPEAIRAELDLTYTFGPRIWRNLPPARVYTYRRG